MELQRLHAAARVLIWILLVGKPLMARLVHRQKTQRFDHRDTSLHNLAAPCAHGWIPVA